MTARANGKDMCSSELLHTRGTVSHRYSIILYRISVDDSDRVKRDDGVDDSDRVKRDHGVDEEGRRGTHEDFK